MSKIAILLPGIGYTCDKPLLYYSGKLARFLGWEVKPVPYSGFPDKVIGDRDRMQQSARIALTQAEDMLQAVPWQQYDKIVFISKSVGTVAAPAYAAAHHLPCRHILFTPVVQTFSYPLHDAIAFHGTADPWADTSDIKALCASNGVALHITENANHSLETGNVDADIAALKIVMGQVKAALEAY